MFRFRLETVLKYRQFLEDQKLVALAEAQRILEEEKEKARKLIDMRAQYCAALREETKKEELSINMLSFYQAYIFYLDRSIERQNKIVARARAVVVEKQQELIEARKQKEVMVKLKERAWKVYKYEEDRRDQIALDETASIKFIRTKQGLNTFASS